VGFEPGRGYVKTESISLTIRLRDSAVTLAANEAGGVTRYSAYGSDFTHGPYAGATGGAVHQFHVGGRFTISGNVRDRAGNAVEGAAVSLNKVVVYSDSAGLFSSRTNKHTVTVEVMPEQFSAPGRWLVVAAPSQAEASVVIEVIVSKN
jgi:hypothetical protein